MGGKGSGGNRVGAGRPRQDRALGELKGSRRTRARVKRQKSNNQTAANQNEQAPAAQAAAPAAGEGLPTDVQIPEPPGSLTLDELAVWNELAPMAARVGTLTAETSWALVDLCRARVLETKLFRDIDRIGNLVPGAGAGTVAANPLLARFTTLRQRVENGMMKFKLSPMGKEIASDGKKPADPFAEFDDQPTSDLTVN